VSLSRRGSSQFSSRQVARWLFRQNRRRTSSSTEEINRRNSSSSYIGSVSGAYKSYTAATLSRKSSMASLNVVVVDPDDGVETCCTAFCRPICACLGCFGFRFDGKNNYFYNVFRSFVFLFQTFLWISFLIILQAAITQTVDYLVSGRDRVIAYWVTCLVVAGLAMVFTHIYMRINTPDSNQMHYIQSGLEKVIHNVIGNHLTAGVSEPSGTTRSKRKKSGRTGAV